MKEVNIRFNGEYLSIDGQETKVFLHADGTLALIHLVEGMGNDFKRRIEFKKKKNDSNKYLDFSFYLNSNIAFSGNLTISEEEEITGNISYQILKENSTHIIEGYYLTINYDNYCLEHIITSNIQEMYLEEEGITTLTIVNIETFLFNILHRINNIHSVKNKPFIPWYPTISQILREENSIIHTIESLIEKYPDLDNFLKSYEQGYERKLTKPRQLF